MPRHARPAVPARPTPAVTSGHLGFVDGIRGLAALYVVLHHTWLGTWAAFPENRGPWAVGWLVYGHLGVAVFIVVSGFSLGIAPARGDHRLRGGARTFFRRRAWRILPPYWAALGFSALVYGLVTRDQTGELITVKAIVVHALLVQDVFDSPKPNGAFWSIAIEWQIYFLFPLVLLAYRRAGRWSMVVAATGAAVGAHLLAISVPVLQPLDRLLPQFFAMFVMGVLAADAVRTPRASRTPLLPLGLALWLVLVVTAAAVGPARVVEQFFAVDLFVGVATALTLAGLCDARRIPLRTVLGSQPLAFLGSFSYSTYLVHAPVLWLVSYELGRRTDLSGTGLFLATLGSAVPVILVGSYAFHVVFERPFMRHRSLRDLRDALPRRVGAGPLRSLAAGRSGHGSTPVHVPVQPAPAGQAAARVATAPES